MAKKETSSKTVFTVNGVQIFDLKKEKDGTYTGTVIEKKVIWDADGRLNSSHPDLYDLNLETIK